ncbi:MAG: hypothetical protein H0W84_11375 [Bacteroidetes bacterium]|nr:hypothetical protein [Bacteroidota bacterium]
MMVLRTVYILVLIGFMGACTHKTSTYNFESADSVKIDESKVVLTRFPIQLEEINDSVIGAINSRKTLSLYNIYSGKNIANFLVDNINFDSLIQSTFQKKYEGKRNYSYSKEALAGLLDMVEQVNVFQYTDTTFYIYVNTISEVDNLNDTALLLKYYDMKGIKKLKKTNKELKMRTNEFVHFLFITDNQFVLKEIIPLYDPPMLKKNNYSPIYERAFYVDGNDLHYFLMKNSEAYETLRSKKNLKSSYTAVSDLKDETKTRLLLNNDIIDYSDFSFDDYLGSSAKFTKKNNELIYFNGKEICEVKNGKKIFSKKNLNANEWITTFYINEDKQKIITLNYNKDKKKNPTEFEEHYAVDSVNTIRIKIFDIKTSKWIAEKKLTDYHYPPLITKNKIIYFDKDKQNYYIKYIRYNEN